MSAADVVTPPRPTLTRDAVITTTRTLIIDEGLDAVSLRRVAGALGVTAPALYAYVTDKRDLMRAVAEFEFGQLIARFEAIDDLDPVVRVRAASRAYIDHAVANPELFKTMFLFPPDLSFGAPVDDELPIATHAFELSLTSITEAIETGAFRPMEPVMAGLTLWTATHGCATVLLLGFAPDDRGREQLITSVIDTMITGFTAVP